ncbi:RNA polymerase-binding transcription factor DksA [Rhodoferax lithotrophicus]|uniref:RNA polymerase-binding transcription factor DksA n=1 Tax=Rhodoferax lithotrophicus TaxID=2798804 RepID=A0ABN6D1Y3_9BURK|nr:TraR/DksA C4-type zinc finger protein [Rhodoferax sp. MIZ03]BCO25899.1 RNA polymerase-binding transcription factor DksA [Rhodoferax sp. MIZ03]
MHTPHPISQLERSTLVDILKLRLASMEQQSDTKLKNLTQAQHAYQLLQQDMDDAPQRSGEEEVEAALSDIDSLEFSALTQALQRIHGADYGLCVDCHLAITFGRLQLEPQTLRCTACQALYERAH